MAFYHTACFSVTESNSKGRRVTEPSHPYRGAFCRDRDRIIHSEAFRRLEGKTQVFTPGVNDNYRNRLTHSLEVAQIGRTIAVVMGVNENLTEAICLAHDLGHSPFGHAGEKYLDELMSEYGGFEHNSQSLRIVDHIEQPYPDRVGINLMYETRLGLAKHESIYDMPDTAEFAEKRGTLEAQIAGVADRIAYDCHDLEDGLRSGLVNDADLVDIELFNEAGELIKADQISNSFVRRTRIAKAVIEILVSDCIANSKRIIDRAGCKNVDDVTGADENFIRLSQPVHEKLAELEKFLYRSIYKNRKIKDANPRIRKWLFELFERLCDVPELMPRYYQQLADKYGLQRGVCDYIAGMTDRYCLIRLNEIRE